MSAHLSEKFDCGFSFDVLANNRLALIGIHKVALQHFCGVGTLNHIKEHLLLHFVLLLFQCPGTFLRLDFSFFTLPIGGWAHALR